MKRVFQMWIDQLRSEARKRDACSHTTAHSSASKWEMEQSPPCTYPGLLIISHPDPCAYPRLSDLFPTPQRGKSQWNRWVKKDSRSSLSIQLVISHQAQPVPHRCDAYRDVCIRYFFYNLPALRQSTSWSRPTTKHGCKGNGEEMKAWFPHQGRCGNLLLCWSLEHREDSKG